MVRDNVTILCYWNGRIISGSRGLAYEGATPKPIKVSNQINYNDLVDKLHTITGLQTRIKITCRYPSNFQEYIALPIENDATLSIIFDVMEDPQIRCLEFYLEAEAIPLVHAPKHPNRPYMKDPALSLFGQDFRKQYKDKPLVDMRQVGSDSAAKWFSLSAEERAPYKATAENLKAEYERKMEAYNRKLAGEADEESDKFKSEVHDEDEYEVARGGEGDEDDD